MDYVRSLFGVELLKNSSVITGISLLEPAGILSANISRDFTTFEKLHSYARFTRGGNSIEDLDCPTSH